MNKTKTLFCLLLIALSFNIQGKPSAESQKTQKKLEALQEKIKKLEKDLYHDKDQEKVLTKELAITEKTIGENSEKLRVFSAENTRNTAKLNSLTKEQQKLIQQLSHQQKEILQLMQTNLEHEKKEKLQLLFSQNNFSSLSRLNQYYQYFYKAKGEKLTSIQKQIENLLLLQNQIVETQKKGKIVQEKWEHEQRQLYLQKNKRTQILLKISKQLSENKTQLSKLEEEEKNLEALLKTLEKKLKKVPILRNTPSNFGKKSRINFPILDANAKLESHPHFANKQNKKSYIRAKSDTPVHAVANGRVVFSEWLRGIGLLLIVDHGNGYMSLYGNNQKLYKSLGDSVKQGEMVARVGQSGGHAEPGLYFEIRKDGKAIDPSSWFSQG